MAYAATTPPTAGDPLPVTLGELHDIGDHAGIMLAVAITDAGGLNITWTAGMIRTPVGDIVITVSGSGTCTDDAVNHLKWVSGTGLTLGTTDATHNAEVAIGHIACQNGDIWEVHTEPVSRVVLTDIQHGLEEVFPLTVASGCLVSEDLDATNPLDVTVSAGAYFHDLHDEHPITAFDTRTANTLIRCFIDGSGPETWDFTADGAQSEIDVGNWNSGTSLISTSAGKYYKGLFVISANNVFWIYAQGEHNTVAQAIDAAIPSTPPGLDNFPRSVTYVYKHGDTAFEPVTSDRWSDVRPLVTGSIAAGPITDHGNLVGLSDDDHTLYLLADGSRGLSGPWAANNDITGLTKLVVDNLTLDGAVIASSANLELRGGNFKLTPIGLGDNVLLTWNALAQDGTLTYMNTEDEFRFSALVQATQLKSTIATGTAPVVVASTTVVANLNADLLDGTEKAGFDYALISGNDGATDVAAAELETLTDGSNADALHVHAAAGITLASGDLTDSANILLADGSVALTAPWAANDAITGLTGLSFGASATIVSSGNTDLRINPLRNLYLGDASTDRVYLGRTTGAADVVIQGATELQFRDSALKIHSSADGQLDIEADTVLAITAPSVTLSGDLNIGGNIVLDGDGVGADIVFGDGQDASIYWTIDGDDHLKLDPQHAAAGHYVILNCPKTTTGDPTGVEGLIYWNTFDNAIKMYADGAWRTLASW